MGASFSDGLRSAGKFSSSRVFRQLDSEASRLARKLEPVNQPDESKRTALSDAWRPSSWLQFFVFQNIAAKIHNHGVKAKLKPALQCREISLRGPDGRHAVPS